MSKRRIAGLALLAGLLMSCNFPLFLPAATATVQPAATETPAFTLPTETATTPAPVVVTATAQPTVAATPTVPMVTPNAVNVNCRSGPDVAYDAVSAVLFGTSAEVTGRSADSSWWYVQDPQNSGAFCWVAASVVTISGPTGGIPVVPPPAPIANKVTVDVSLPSTVTCGGPNPVQFSGTISTNGAATVQYQWEITGDKTNTTSPQTLSFTTAGTQDAANPGAYNVDCGSYKITLHVISPNNISAGKNFKVSAP